MFASPLSFGLAFVAGLVTFLSPCMLPLVPIFLAQLVGRSGYQSRTGQEEQPKRFVTFMHALMFVRGFTLAFVSLGATASTLGSFLAAHQFQLRQIGGALLVLIGLHMTGLFRLPFLYQQKSISFRPAQSSYRASLLIGMIFAIGWTPCISLVLGSILGLAATGATLRQGVLLLFFYSLGMGLPFLLLGLSLDRGSRLLRRIRPYLRYVEVGTGIVMMLVGIAIFFNWLVYLNHFAPYVPLHLNLGS
jgi:cytochrome c-type biogenesis protein